METTRGDFPVRYDTSSHSKISLAFSASTTNGTSTGDCLQLQPNVYLPCNNADNLISMETRLLVQDVMYVWILPVLATVGVVTNVINCAVFLAQGLRDQVNMCLFCLSLADTLYLLMLYVRRLHKTLGHVMTITWDSEVLLMSLVRYRLVALHAGFALVSNFISSVIAVERCLCVTWPLRAARILRTSSLAAGVLVCSALILAGIQFVAFKYDISCAVIEGVDSPPFTVIAPSKLYKEHPSLMDVLDTFFFSALVPILSLIVTSVATTLTAIQLRRVAAWRDSAARRTRSSDVIHQKEKALTQMLVVISCIYIACVSPRMLRSLCRFFVPGFRAWGSLCNLLLVTEALMDILLALNSSINFFVYYIMSSRFRTTLLACGRTRSTKRPSSMVGDRAASSRKG